MARRMIEKVYYTFNPQTNTVTIPRIIRQDRLMLITNTTLGTVIYNFADNTLNAASFSITGASTANPTTVIVLKYNCGAMSSTDSLAINFVLLLHNHLLIQTLNMVFKDQNGKL